MVGQGGMVYPQETIDQEEQESDLPAISTQCNSRKDAVNILRNLRNSGNQIEMLDGMGYGDIASIIEHLGPINRGKLRIILRNRASELGVDPEKIDVDLENMSQEINDFNRDFGEKTPKEIEAFESDVLQKIKYSCLLYDARRGDIMRRIKTAFSRDDERINNLKEKMISYYDGKTKRRQDRFGLLNNLRKNVGKTAINQPPVVARGSRDSRSRLDQRNVPTNSGETR